MSGRRSVGRTAGATRAIRPVRSVTTRSNAASSPVRAGSGMDQCSRPGLVSASGELFMGRIADGDDEVGRAVVGVAGAEDVVDVPRRERSQRDGVSPGRGDGAGVHGGCGVCAGRRRRDRAGAVPQRGGELRTRGVVGADEHDPDRVVHLGRSQRGERAGRECQVGAAPVRLRAVPGQHTGLLQRADVVGEQVRRHVEELLQLGRGRLTQEERVDDGQPSRFAQGGVHGSAPHQPTVPLSLH